MKNIFQKLKSKRGETLVEILVAILIIALSAGLCATMYIASMNINLTVQEQDEAFYDAVGALELFKKTEDTQTDSGELHYHSEKSDQNVNVEILTQDGLSVYHEEDT